MLHKVFFWLLTILLLTSLVNAEPPVTTLQTNDALTLRVPAKQYFQAGSFYEFEVHVFNTTNYVTDATCYFHFYNTSGQHTIEMFDGTVSHDYDYSFEVQGGNFTLGESYYSIQCNTTSQVGFSNQEFFINNSGEEPTTPKMIAYFSLLFMMLILFIIFVRGVFTTENVIGKWAFYFASHLFWIAGTFSVWQISWAFLTTNVFIEEMFRIMFWFGIITLFPMIIIALFFTGYMIVMDNFLRKLMEKGVGEREATERWNRRKKKW